MQPRTTPYHSVSVGGSTEASTDLGAFAARIERAYAQNDYALAADLIGGHILEAWFGLDPTLFMEILYAVSQDERVTNKFVITVGRLLIEGFEGRSAEDRGAGRSAEDRSAGDHGAVEQDSTQEAGLRAGADISGASLAAVLRVYQLRLEGRPVESWAAAQALDERGEQLQPLFDRTRGWGLFTAVQSGTTAMLAGDLMAALDCFTRARMHPSPPSLMFLVRDACVKAAVIEALYGDHDRARALLDEAERVPRTASWAEAGLDAMHRVAASQVRAETPEEGLSLVDSVPLRDLGEMWPYYVVALQRSLWEMRKTAESARRLDLFNRLPLPRVEGQGYTGSAIPLTEAMNAMMNGDLLGARECLERADAACVMTQVLVATLELVSGRPREALRSTVGLSKRTAGLEGLDIWRLATIAGSHFSLGELDECSEVLQFLLNRPRGVSAREARFFPAEVRAFAEAKFEEWPRPKEAPAFAFEMFAMNRQVLTEREVEVLQALASGRSREQIAREQFISMNTLKAHLRSVYRKLGVGSRSAAVLEGERRGLV